MNPLLQHLCDELTAAIATLDAAQTQLQPQLRPTDAPAKWTIQQIVEHLLLTYRRSATTFETRLAKGTPTQAQPTLAQRFGQFVVLTLAQFPKGREAPPMVAPPPTTTPRTGAALAAEATELLTRFDTLATEAERLFGRRRAISHQVLGPLNVRQWRQFQLVHARHHLKQIRAIRASHGIQT